MTEQAASPDQCEFSEVWGDLSPRLARVLRARHVPEDIVDDLVQETGFRLYRKWQDVDPGRVWPLARAVLTNLVRDELRRQEVRERHGREEAQTVDGFEESVIYGLELRRVEKVLRQLSEIDRQVLLAEWGERLEFKFASPAALKMARMRARRRLREALEKVSSLVPLWRLRIAVLGRDRSALRLGEQLSQVAVACVVLVTAGVATFLPPSRSFSNEQAIGRGFLDVVDAVAVTRGPDANRAGTELSPDPSFRTDAGLALTAGDPRAPRRSDEELNQNFGPIRTDGSDVWIGEGSGLGPYGADEGAETSVGGQKVGARARVKIVGPKCDEDLYIFRPQTYECTPAETRGRASAETAGHKQEVETDGP